MIDLKNIYFFAYRFNFLAFELSSVYTSSILLNEVLIIMDSDESPNEMSFIPTENLKPYL